MVEIIFLGSNLFWKKKILQRYQLSVLVHFRRKKLFWKKKMLKNYHVDNFVVEYLTQILLVNLREKII